MVKNESNIGDKYQSFYTLLQAGIITQITGIVIGIVLLLITASNWSHLLNWPPTIIISLPIFCISGAIFERRNLANVSQISSTLEGISWGVFVWLLTKLIIQLAG